MKTMEQPEPREEYPGQDPYYSALDNPVAVLFRQWSVWQEEIEAIINIPGEPDWTTELHAMRKETLRQIAEARKARKKTRPR